MKAIFQFMTLIPLFFLLFGCGERDEIVVDNGQTTIFDSLSVNEIREIQRGTPCLIRTVVEGNKTVDLTGEFLEVMDDSGLGLSLLVCESSDARLKQYSGIVAGMSGSPVLINGKVIGALAYAFGFTTNPPYVFLATPLEYMQELADKKSMEDYLNMAPAKFLGLMPVKIPLSLPVSWGDKTTQEKTITQNPNLGVFNWSGNSHKAVVADSGSLKPGEMIAVTLACGPLVNAEAYGTVSWIKGNEIYAFGHTFLGAGKFQAPFRRAWVHKVVSSNYEPFKFCSSYGDFLGTINKDFTPGISGTLGKIPAMIPVALSYMGPNGQTKEITHYVTPGAEWLIGDILTTVVYTLRDEESSGSMEGAVTLEFSETEKIMKMPIRVSSCSPLGDIFYQIGDLVGMFTDRVGNNVARATLKKVTLEINDSAEIKTAEIISVDPRGDLTAGQTCEVEVKVKPYRSVPVSKIISLEIPVDFPKGGASLSAVANEVAVDDLMKEKAEKDKKENEFPENLDELISKVEKDWVRQKIVVTLSSTSFGDTVPGESLVETPSEVLQVPEIKPVKGEIGVAWIIDGNAEKEVEVK